MTTVDTTLHANQHSLKVGAKVRDREYGVGTVKSLIYTTYYKPSPTYYVEFDNRPTRPHLLSTCGGVAPSGLGGVVREDYIDAL